MSVYLFVAVVLLYVLAAIDEWSMGDPNRVQ